MFPQQQMGQAPWAGQQQQQQQQGGYQWGRGYALGNQ